MCRHRFGHNGYFLDIISPVRRISEHFRRMNIADYVIYIPIVHNNFGDTHSTSTFFKSSSEAVTSTATTSVRGTIQSRIFILEIKRILKDFHFRIQLFLISSILYTRLHEIIQIDFAECLIGRFLIYPHAK